MSDKEALERLKVDEIANDAVHQWNADGHPHLSTGAIGVARIAAEIARAGSIAEREGLEREVERLKVDLSGQEADNDSYRAIANAECNRAEAAEAKLSALEEAVQDAVNARDDADHALPDHLREPLIRALAALSNQGKPSS